MQEEPGPYVRELREHPGLAEGTRNARLDELSPHNQQRARDRYSPHPRGFPRCRWYQLQNCPFLTSLRPLTGSTLPVQYPCSSPAGSENTSGPGGKILRDPM